jgi:hypothetical protein
VIEAGTTLTAREAYEAMCRFLDAYWERGGKRSDDIAGLLGATAMHPDGRPLDQAQWNDWLVAVGATLSGREGA